MKRGQFQQYKISRKRWKPVLFNSLIILLVSMILSLITAPIMNYYIEGYLQSKAIIAFAESIREKQEQYKKLLTPYAGSLRSFASSDTLSGTSGKQKLNDMAEADAEKYYLGKTKFSDFKPEDVTQIEELSAKVSKEKKWTQPTITIKHITNGSSLVFVMPEKDGFEMFGDDEDIDDSNKVVGYYTNIIYYFVLTAESQKAAGLPSTLTLVLDMNGTGGLYEGSSIDIDSAVPVYGGPCLDASQGTSVDCKVAAANSASESTNQKAWEKFSEVLLPAEKDKSWVEEYIWDSGKPTWVNVVDLLNPIPIPIEYVVGDQSQAYLNNNSGVAQAGWGAVGKVAMKLFGGKIMSFSLKKSVTKMTEAGLLRQAKKLLAKKMTAEELEKLTLKEALEKVSKTKLYMAYGAATGFGLVVKATRATIGWALIAGAKILLLGAAVDVIASLLNINCREGNTVSNLISGNFQQIIGNILNCLYMILIEPVVKWATTLLQQSAELSLLYYRPPPNNKLLYVAT